ncbi:class I tRNA ligase family protein [Micromonospora chersina]|uniref:class I tRNA ligase family protein n=1 Tax=Micromonospora chersina TaxID=47854 RepID=UPI0033DF9038
MSRASIVSLPSPTDHLVSSTYHTPNGPLHLGHISGPFLNADVVARHLEMLGHRVHRVSTTDSRESYVLLTARQLGLAPERVATFYHDLAAETLTGLNMPQDSFFNTHEAVRALRYAQRSQRIAEFLQRRGRIHYSRVRYPRGAATGQFLVGGFVLGNCPRCAADAAGACCEECGLWFDITQLVDPRPRLAEDGGLTWAETGAATLDAGDVFTMDNVAARFPAAYHHLYEDYVRWNGTRLPLTHPLGWGVPWEVGDLGDAVVHHSYAIGAHVSMNAVAEELSRITGLPDPFSQHSPVIKITTGGYDAVLPWMFHVALMDKESDWEPFDHHIITRYMLLDGEKFSTSRRHAIWAHDYVRSGLSVDALRMYLATISPSSSDSDLRLSDLSRYVRDMLETLVEKRTRQAAARMATSPGLVPLSEAGSTAVRRFVVAFNDSLAPGSFDLAAAAELVHEWCATGGDGLADREPYWWCKVTSLLTYPIMPTWARALWAWLGHAAEPTFVQLEQFPAQVPVGSPSLPALSLDPVKVAALAHPDEFVGPR